MRLLRRRPRNPVVSLVVPAYDVADFLPACLDSILAQTFEDLEVVVVDDGSPDASGDIAEAYAARDPRVRVLHIANRGLGGARNEGMRHVRGELLGFADSDDLLPPDAVAHLVEAQRTDGADFVVGGVERLQGDGDGAELVGLPWMRRLHRERRTVAIEEHPEILGDVFAWNKLFHRDFVADGALHWPERLRYEDQPATTQAYLRARRFTVIPEVVYHWRVREDGSSITQQRATLADLRDRWRTKQMSLDAVQAHGSAKVTRIFRNRVLPGDMARYFTEIPGCEEEWWHELRDGVAHFWDAEWPITDTRMAPVFRLVGWLVTQDRREDAAAVVTYARELGRPLDRVQEADHVRIDVPVLDLAGVDPAALRLHPEES
ncbi:MULTISPECIES: glycosyltransferase family 2 protein [unclassified Nocardioides]|uniref:glycosyltransferase family 2 protein n=1 Tax=unclassified Nocardioides TaxID=2615069 RepID=UPI001E366154|nr:MULTISPECIES: glycosyltransferase family 2 protein [unclassified Nocardioides]